MPEAIPEGYTEQEIVRQKVQRILMDMQVEVIDKIGRTVPPEQWPHVPSVLRQMGEHDLADDWEDSEEG